MLVPDDKDLGVVDPETDVTNLEVASPETTPPGDGGEKPSTVKVGEEELPLDQVAELVSAGKTLKEIQEQYPDIDIRGMIPSFTKLNQLVRDPEKLIEYARTKFPDKFPGSQPGAETPQEAKQVLDWMKQNGFITQAQAQEQFQVWYQQAREDERFEDTLSNLETKFDGKDGRPKFDRRKVLTHGKTKGIYDPEAAYENLYKNELREFEAAEKLGRKPKAPATEKGGAGVQVPKDGKMEFGSKALSNAMDRVLDEEGTD